MWFAGSSISSTSLSHQGKSTAQTLRQIVWPNHLHVIMTKGAHASYSVSSFLFRMLVQLQGVRWTIPFCTYPGNPDAARASRHVYLVCTYFFHGQGSEFYPELPEHKHMLRVLPTVCVCAKRYTKISLYAAERRFGSREDNRIRDAYKEMHIKTDKHPLSNRTNLLSINH